MARNFVRANSERIDLPAITDAAIGTAWTVAIRFRMSSLGTLRHGLLCQRSTTVNNTSLFNFEIQPTGDQMRFFAYSDTAEFANLLAPAPTVGVWHTMIGRRNGTDFRLFRDGVDSANVTQAFGTVTTDDLKVGAQVNGSTTAISHADADIADVAIWNAVLTQDEIDAYHRGVSPNLIRPNNLFRYYPFWGTTEEADLTGSGEKGTLVNSPAVSITNPVSGRYSPSLRGFAPAVELLAPYAPPVDPNIDFVFDIPAYVAPVSPDVDFDIKVAVTGVLTTGELVNKYTIVPVSSNLSELANKYEVAVARLKENGSLSNKYSVAKATLGLAEQNNLYGVSSFRLAEGELGNAYSIATALLALGELHAKYNVPVAKLKFGEFLNKYGVTPSVLTLGEIADQYSVESFRLKVGELLTKYKVNPVTLLLGELQQEYEVGAARLKEGLLQNQYIVQDSRVEAQLISIYSIRLAKQFESIYGATVTRQFLSEAYYTLSKQFESLYSINTVAKRQLESVYDITNQTFANAQLESKYAISPIANQLRSDYSIGLVVANQLKSVWASTIPVSRQLSSLFDIKNTNPVSKQFKSVFAILTSQIVNITGQPTVTLGGQVLDIESADVSIDEGSFVWRANIGILNIEDYVKFAINDEITLNLYGEIFNLIVESKRLSRGGPAEVSMGLVAVSPAIKYDFPRAKAIEVTFTSDILAQTAAEQVLGGVDIDWQLIDWIIPANRLAIKDGSPIQLVQTIVEAAGGVLESKPDGQLVARPLFPVSLTKFPTASVDHTYTDSSDNLSVSEQFSPTKRLNLFRIFDVSSTNRDNMEFEFDDIVDANGTSTKSTTEGVLKIFPSPFRTDLQVKSSRGGEVAFQLIGVATEQREQQVEFKEGFSSLSKPIESIDSVVWEGTSLGAISFAQGDTKISSASVVNLYGLATIKYTTKFLKYKVSGIENVDVQFRTVKV